MTAWGLQSRLLAALATAARALDHLDHDDVDAARAELTSLFR